MPHGVFLDPLFIKELYNTKGMCQHSFAKLKINGEVFYNSLYHSVTIHLYYCQEINLLSILCGSHIHISLHIKFWYNSKEIHQTSLSPFVS